MKKVLIGFLVIVGGLVIAYFSGPKVSFDPVNSGIEMMDVPVSEIEAYIESSERMTEGIKDDNHSKIYWADSGRKTPYVIVYLHGFSASPMESNPVHIELAKKFGCNLYTPRLSQHGLKDEDAFLQLTPESLMASAREAIAVGKTLGDKVILMSCSTGGTLSIYLSAMNPELIHAQLLYSPNIQVFNPALKIANDPWGAQILKQITGDFRESPDEVGTEVEKYWSLKYRSEGLIALQDLIEQTMTEDVFKNVKQPFFLGYYYKNEEEQDNVVSVPAMLNYYDASGTKDSQKVKVAFPEVANHVIASDLQSKDINSVREATEQFMIEVLAIQPVL